MLKLTNKVIIEANNDLPSVDVFTLEIILKDFIKAYHTRTDYLYGKSTKGVDFYGMTVSEIVHYFYLDNPSRYNYFPQNKQK